MFDRLVCMNGGNPRPELIDKKDTLKAQALERSPLWREISKNHLSGRTAAFFCYGDDGADEEDGNGMPKHLEHPQWFDAKAHPLRGKNERDAYQGQVWQCRYSDIEVPDPLWKSTVFGTGKPYADDQVEDMVGEKDRHGCFPGLGKVLHRPCRGERHRSGYQRGRAFRPNHDQPGQEENLRLSASAADRDGCRLPVCPEPLVCLDRPPSDRVAFSGCS
jgi:hypothetical protein